uniref:Uncharacterized protein n=1 Tax=Knipowitschia caucasica TaxID=637954 RepID=A0AAV2LEM1_KNICA
MELSALTLMVPRSSKASSLFAFSTSGKKQNKSSILNRPLCVERDKTKQARRDGVLRTENLESRRHEVWPRITLLSRCLGLDNAWRRERCNGAD